MLHHRQALLVLCSVAMLNGVQCNFLTELLGGQNHGSATDVNGTTAAQDDPTSSYLTYPSKLCASYKCGCDNADGTVPRKIDCSYKNINTLSRVSVPENVIEINLSGNNLSKVFDTYFYAGSALHFLDLSHNSIDFVAITSFQMFRQLNKLSLAHNRLTSLEEDVFRGLNKLQILDLSYNRLSTFYPKDFDYLNNLDELILSHNPLMEFNGNAFAKLTSLNRLNLQSTGITNLRATDFDSLTNLKWLDLSGNGFREVPAKGLHKLSLLRHLDLGRNPIAALPPHTFYNLTSLRSLSFRHMSELTSIGANAFCELSSLKIIDFSFCPKLKSIHRRAFTHNYSSEAKIELDEFYVRQTSLESLPEDLVNWDYVNKVDFAENNWKCDCMLEWMPHIVKRDALDGKLRCRTPKEMEGRLIAKLTTEDFRCADKLSLEHPGWTDVNVAMKVALGLLITITVALAGFIVVLVFFRIRSKPHMYRSLKQKLGYSVEE